MKKGLSLLTAAGLPAILMATAAVLFFANSDMESTQLSEKWRSRAQNINAAVEWQTQFRTNDVTGKVEMSDYEQAVIAADKLKEELANSGRAISSNIQWDFVGPDNVGGRTRAILVDPNNSDIVYAGGVAGGLYKSTDATKSWSKIQMPDETYMTNISCIARGADGAIYIGTGEDHAQGLGSHSGFNSGAPGDGVYVSTDNGSTFTHLPSTATPVQGNVQSGLGTEWYGVNSIACDPTDANKIYAATHEGLYYSDDKGVTWTSLRSADCDDVKITPNGIPYFACNNDLFKYFSANDSLINLSSTINGAPNPPGRMEIATSPSDGRYVYCSTCYGGSGSKANCLFGIYQTEDGGASWNLIGPPEGDLEPFAQLNQSSTSGCQGWYDNTIAVNVADPEKIYVGGITFWTWGANEGWALADNIGRDERHPSYIHADKHAIAMDPSNPEVMYVGHDGGVTRSNNATSAFPYPTYKTNNKGYGVTQFYAIAASTCGRVFGGTQDNSSPYITINGNTPQAANVLLGGDGAYTEISRFDETIMFGESQFGAMRRSGNGGEGWSSMMDTNLDSDGEGEPSGGCPAMFIAPFWLVETNDAPVNNDSIEIEAGPTQTISAGTVLTLESKIANQTFEYTMPVTISNGQSISVPDKTDAKLYMSTNCGLYVNPDPLNLTTQIRWFLLKNFSNSSRTPMSLSATKDGNTLFVGSENVLLKIEGMTQAKFDKSFNQWSAAGDGISASTVRTFSNFVRGVYVDRNDDDHIVVGLSGFGTSPRVFRSTDGGNNWTDIQNNLPFMPIYDILISESDPNVYIAATELGTWISMDQGATWEEANVGMARGPVYRLRQQKLYEDGCPVIYAGTHGQGAFRTTDFTPAGCDLTAGKCSDVTSISGQPVQTLAYFDVYPNPIKGSGKIQLSLDEAAGVQVNVIDMPGRLVRQFEFNGLSQGDHTLDFDLEGLPKGNYVMSIRASNSTLYDSRILIVQ